MTRMTFALLAALMFASPVLAGTTTTGTGGASTGGAHSGGAAAGGGGHGAAGGSAPHARAAAHAVAAHGAASSGDRRRHHHDHVRGFRRTNEINRQSPYPFGACPPFGVRRFDAVDVCGAPVKMSVEDLM